MGFDASKLVVGKKYPTRDGGKVEFVRAWRWSTIGEVQLIWLSCLGDEYGQCYTSDASGRQMTVTKVENGMDIISDEPLKEPVEMTRTHRWEVVDDEGDGIELFTDRDDAVTWMNRSLRAVGIHELPEKILVTPR